MDKSLSVMIIIASGQEQRAHFEIELRVETLAEEIQCFMIYVSFHQRAKGINPVREVTTN